MAESNEDENNDVQMKEICVIPIDQPGQKKWSFGERPLFPVCSILFYKAGK